MEDFFITQPTLGTQWVNGQSNVVTWKKGLLDDIPSFDVELARLSSDGLIYVAQSGAPPLSLPPFPLT